jgi:hypothetical protein
VIWIWMENHQVGAVLGSHAAPYENVLAARCATVAAYEAVGSPSLPNYLGATSGTTSGVEDDAAPSSHPISADNLFRQVRAAGGTALSYQEAMPTNCALNSSGRYAVKHNPAAYYVGADDRAACGRDDVPLGTPDAGPLASALDANTPPTFAFITPDLCNDTHDCPVSTGDDWLASWLPRILDSPGYRSGTMAVFLVWDEPTPMPFVAIAPRVTPGLAVPGPTSHFGLLRATEDLLGLPPLGAAADAPGLAADLRLTG